MNTTTKTCSKCRSVLNVTEFGPRADALDGLRGECRQCRVGKQREWTRANDGHCREGSRHRQAAWRERSPERAKAVYAASKARYPNGWRARNKVNHAIAAGRMARPADLMCIDCGNQAQDYDHFLGYDPAHWLHVQPVCRPCHGKRRRKA